MRLYRKSIDFKTFEAEGNDRRYWLWTNSHGWLYRDHVIEGLQPLDQHVDFSPIELNTKSAEERAQEQLDKARDIIKRHMPKKNQFGYGQSKTSVVA